MSHFSSDRSCLARILGSSEALAGDGKAFFDKVDIAMVESLVYRLSLVPKTLRIHNLRGGKNLPSV